LDDVFIAVKTSAKFHRSRLWPVLATWYSRAGPNVWFFTDAEDAALSRLTGGRVINTGCAADHSRMALSCKMEAELDAFLKAASDRSSSTAWFCHFDDDNYVNMDRLMTVLAAYPASKEWYLGKVSTAQPLEVPYPRRSATSLQSRDSSSVKPPATQSFWFATGGAGFCLSRPLVERMQPWISGGRFQQLADEIRLPDDVAVGYVVAVLMGVPLTPLADFHSHLEPLRLVTDFGRAISLSYSQYEDTGEDNVVEVEDKLRLLDTEQREEDEDVKRTVREDRTRFLYVHCRLHPGECRQLSAVVSDVEAMER
jgi:fringe protein